MALLTIARLFTASSIILGVYCLHIFGESNGLFPQITDLRARGLLDPTGPKFDPVFTGYGPVDAILSALLIFFWPLVNGQHPHASLLSFLFVGQSVAVWSAVVLEAARHANRGRLITFTTIYGLLIQTIGFAVVAPCYLTLYLFTSPLLTSAAPLTPADLVVPEGVLSGLPFGVAIGFILPTIFMSLPTPDVLTLSSKITAMLVWQIFPLTVAICTQIWNTLLWPKIDYTDEARALASQRTLLRFVYQFAMLVSVAAHIVTATLSLSPSLFPGLFTPAARAALHPASVFLPPNPFSDRRVSSVAQSSPWFLQFDYYITSLVYVVWALASRYSSRVLIADRNGSRLDLGSFSAVIAKSVLLGPMSTALTLLWDRDEVVFAAAQTAVAKKNT